MRSPVLFAAALAAALAGSPARAESPAPAPAPVAAPATPPAASQVIKRFAAEDLVAIVRDEGYGSPAITETGAVRFKFEGSDIVLLIESDGDLQLYYGVRLPNIGLERINDWNHKRRLTRAYLDDDKDPALEGDMFLDAGATRDQVAQFLRIFTASVGEFKHFLTTGK